MANKSKDIGSYDYEGLISYWLNNDTIMDMEVTAGNRLSYDDDCLFSYTTVIATKKSGYIWITPDRHSNTTAKHKSIVIKLTDKPIVSTPSIENNKRNVEYFVNIITEAIHKIQQARKPHTVSERKQELRNIIHNYSNYVKYVEGAKEIPYGILMTAIMTAKE